MDTGAIHRLTARLQRSPVDAHRPLPSLRVSRLLGFPMLAIGSTFSADLKSGLSIMPLGAAVNFTVLNLDKGLLFVNTYAKVLQG